MEVNQIELVRHRKAQFSNKTNLKARGKGGLGVSVRRPASTAKVNRIARSAAVRRSASTGKSKGGAMSAEARRFAAMERLSGIAKNAAVVSMAE